MPGQDRLIPNIEANPKATFKISTYDNHHLGASCFKPARILYERITKEAKRNWIPRAMICPVCLTVALLENCATVRPSQTGYYSG